MTRKLQVPISFPTGQLDMTPYTSAAILRWEGEVPHFHTLGRDQRHTLTGC